MNILQNAIDEYEDKLKAALVALAQYEKSLQESQSIVDWGQLRVREYRAVLVRLRLEER